MSNAELLTMAAKAIGLTGDAEEYANGFAEFVTTHMLMHGGNIWNPLRNDGDALRLIVNLKILGLWDAEITRQIDCIGWEQDPYAATRKAIVTFAAKIGKDQP